MSRCHKAKINNDSEVVVGAQANQNGILHVDGGGDIFVMELSEDEYRGQTSPMQSHINVGSGDDVSIGELAATIAQVVGYEGKIVFDASKPDGSPRKLLNVDLLKSLGKTTNLFIKWHRKHLSLTIRIFGGRPRGAYNTTI